MFIKKENVLQFSSSFLMIQTHSRSKIFEQSDSYYDLISVCLIRDKQMKKYIREHYNTYICIPINNLIKKNGATLGYIVDSAVSKYDYSISAKSKPYLKMLNLAWVSDLAKRNWRVNYPFKFYFVRTDT